ncbi:MAG: hypothetical protein IT285_10185 [Bdellovibrionales bacterium]|nr:hypothetical protein [Bdellovibrionales bacterium]
MSPARPEQPAPGAGSEIKNAESRKRGPLQPAPLGTLVAEYGDELFDLCLHAVHLRQHPLQVFRAVIRDLKRAPIRDFDRYRRLWVLGTATRRIMRLGRMESGRDVVDPVLFSSSANNAEGRLALLDQYFHRLPPESRLLLLLRERHELTLDEVGTILGTPAASLELRHRQVLDVLVGWIWQEPPKANSKNPTPLPPERRICDVIRGWPRVHLPEEIRKAPLSAVAMAAASAPVGAAQTRSPWQKAPWFIRSGAEAIGLAVVILGVVALVPKMRQLYERNLEDQLATFRSEDLSLDLDTDFATEQPELIDETIDENPTVESTEPDVATAEKTAKPVRIEVGNSEIWRFNIKTPSPGDLRPKITQMLLDLAVPPDTKGIQGIEAPGGIQFNLFIPKEIVAEAKTRLERLAAPPAGTDSASSITSDFTWYKIKSRKNIPKGQAQLVVWIQRVL